MMTQHFFYEYSELKTENETNELRIFFGAVTATLNVFPVFKSTGRNWFNVTDIVLKDIMLKDRVRYFSLLQELVMCCEKGKNIFQEHPKSPASTALLELVRTIQNMQT